MIITRATQKLDRIYSTPAGVFVSPDGDGRIWFDSIAEAREATGLGIVVLATVDPFER